MGPFAQKAVQLSPFYRFILNSARPRVTKSWQCLQRMTHIVPAIALAAPKSKVCTAHLIQPFWGYVTSALWKLLGLKITNPA